jgi:hypothetical protein
MSKGKALRFLRFANNAGRFTRDWEGEDQVDALRGLVGRGDLSPEGAIMAARRIAALEPDNLEAHQFLATLYWEGGLKEDAAALWAQLFKRVSALIPPDFNGRIEWELDNRPFLRFAHGHLLGLMYRRDAAAASKHCRRLLAWDPDDNLGVRYLQPQIAVMNGHFKTAYNQFLKTAPTMPNGWYHAARIAFLEERFVTALTHLRRGILANPYIAEAITGRRVLFKHLRWHGSNLADHSMAISFLDLEFDGWKQEEIDFVDWGFNCSMVMRERTEAIVIGEGLTYEHEYDVRSRLVDRGNALEAKITEASSAPVIHKVLNRYRVEHWPWDRVGVRHPEQRGWSAEQAAFSEW